MGVGVVSERRFEALMKWEDYVLGIWGCEHVTESTDRMLRLNPFRTRFLIGCCRS